MLLVFRTSVVFMSFYLLSNMVIGSDTKRMDSIASLLNVATKDHDKADLLLEMGKVCMENNPAQSQLYLNRALNRAERADYQWGQANIYLAYGDLYFMKKDSFRISLGHYTKALDRFLMLRDTLGIMKGHYKIGMAEFVLQNYAKAISSIEKSLYYSEDLGDDLYKVKALNALGLIYKNDNNTTKAISHFERALDLAREINDDEYIPKIIKNLGNQYKGLGYSSIAIKYYLESLKIYRKSNDSISLADNLFRLGLLHKDFGNMDKAYKYIFEAFQIREKINSHGFYKGESLSGIASIYVAQKKYSVAIEYYKKALEYFVEINRPAHIQICYGNIGYTYEKMRQYKEAVHFLTKSLEMNQVQGVGGTSIYGSLMNHFANISLNKKDYRQALINVNKAMSIKVSPTTRRRSFKVLSDIYNQKKDHKKAFHYYKKYTNLNDSLIALKKERNVQEFQTLYEVNKKTKEIQLLKKEKEINSLTSAAEIKRQKTFRNAFILSGLAFLIIAALIYSRYRLKNKANLLLRSKNKQIEDQNTNILDSITYAKRIQDAILTSDKYMDAALGEYFVYYQPKDIVSGDFYWVYELDPDNVIIAVADCTGHGVPGAFMSMIGNALLNEIIIENGNTQIEEVLNILRAHIIKSLKQDNAQDNTMDGMDISLLKVNKQNHKLEFAAAGHRIYLLRDGQCHDYKGDAFPVAYYHGKERSFNLHEIDIQEGDTIYLTTDGFLDQFGGPNRNKFGLIRFKELIVENKSQNIKNQKDQFMAAFRQWKEEQNQIDDILVMGIKIS